MTRCPTEQSLHTREKFQQAKRLRDVVVRSKPQALHFVSFLSPGGEDENRRFEAAIAQRLQDMEAVQFGKHEVEDHEIRRRLLRPYEANLPVTRHVHLMALDLQVVPEPEGQVSVVL